jgi:MFS family permease
MTVSIMLISLRHLQISEVTPRGKEFLFFSLFNIVGKASSFVGPVVSSAIIDAMPSHNSSAPFYFLTALSAVSFGFILLFVDLKESRKEQDMFLEDERRARSALRRTLELKDPWQVSGSGSID